MGVVKRIGQFDGGPTWILGLQPEMVEALAPMRERTTELLADRAQLQRLLDAGFMQIVAVTDPLQVGFSRQAMIGITVDGDLTPVGDALADLDEVSYVVTTAGSFDLLAEVVCEDDDGLLTLITERIRSLPGVRTTETFVYLKLNKQHYNWGTR